MPGSPSGVIVLGFVSAGIVKTRLDDPTGAFDAYYDALEISSLRPVALERLVRLIQPRFDRLGQRIEKLDTWVRRELTKESPRPPAESLKSVLSLIERGAAGND